MIKKISTLLINPSENIRKIIPYIKRNTIRLARKISEPFGVGVFSKPYPGQKELSKYLNFRNGFFVEVGANDGYFQDPTYYYEKMMNWKGLLIEPLPYLYQICKNNRSASQVYNYACVPKSYKDTEVTLIDNHAMSFIKNGIKNQEEWIEKGEQLANRQHKEIKVAAKTITSILDEYSKEKVLIKKIDLMCIDVEGYELEVLKGLDFKKYYPEYILLECHNNYLLEKIEKYLSKYYTKISFIPHFDYLFKKL